MSPRTFRYYRLARLVSVTVVAGLGTAQIATHSYAMQLMNLIVLFTLALGFAGEILVGHQVGAGQLLQAMRTVRKSLLWGLAVSTGIAILAAATALLWITVLLEPGRTCNVVVINALRASGDARFPVAAGAASMLFVMAGGSWLLGAHFGLGLVGVWIAYAVNEWLRSLTMATRWFALGWLPAVRATRRRVARVSGTQT